MIINEKILKNKKVNEKKLKEFGFIERADLLIYCIDIMQGEFSLEIMVDKKRGLNFRVIDKDSNEEYALIKDESAVGAFVGKVRGECEKIFDEILKKCFDANLFKCRQTLSIVAYAREKYRSELEFLWEEYPNNAILREEKSGKWYAAILTVEYEKLGIEKEGVIEVINLKASPENVTAIVDNKRYFRAYHMNKKHWLTVPLDGRVGEEEIKALMDESYRLVAKRK